VSEARGQDLKSKFLTTGSRKMIFQDLTLHRANPPWQGDTKRRL
jgi:hypothetical protein